MATFVLDTIGKTHHVKNLLYISDTEPDYLKTLMLHGFKELYGKQCHDYPMVDHLYTDYNKDGCLYGKGMTYSKLLDKKEYREEKYDDNVNRLVKLHYFDIVVYGNIHRCDKLLHLVKKHYHNNEIVLLCGEDFHDVCVLHEHSDYHRFKREL